MKATNDGQVVFEQMDQEGMESLLGGEMLHWLIHRLLDIVFGETANEGEQAILDAMRAPKQPSFSIWQTSPGFVPAYYTAVADATAHR